MKRHLLLAGTLLLSFPLFAQTEKFDIASYTAPAGWTKNLKEGVVIYSKTDSLTGGFCVIALYAATPSLGTPKKDFEKEWKALAVTPFQAEPNPQTETQTSADGWKATAAASPVSQDGVGSYVILTVYSGFGKTTSILANLNDQLYVTELDQFLEGIRLDKKATVKSATNSPALSNNNITINAIAGQWGKSSSSPSMYNNGVINNLAYSGYTKGQYQFNADGTYRFQGESWGGYLNSNEYRLIDENGTYTVNGNQLSIIPARSLYRVVDKNGTLKKSEKIALTKRSYSWQKHYYEGIQETNLILTANRENVIDGKFTSNNLFANSWLYGNTRQLEFKFLPLK